MTHHHRDRRRAGEGRRTGEHFIHDASKRIKVAARVDHVAAGLLGTHVHRRTDGYPNRGQLFITRRANGLRDAKVGHDGVAVIDEDVFRLDVTMHDAARMRVTQRIRDLVGQPEGIVDRQRSAAREQIAQALALHEGHHVKEKSLALAGVIQRKNVGIPQPGGRGDLAQEPVVTQGGR